MISFIGQIVQLGERLDRLWGLDWEGQFVHESLSNLSLVDAVAQMKGITKKAFASRILI